MKDFKDSKLTLEKLKKMDARETPVKLISSSNMLQDDV